jgi:hypothetical protein
MPRRSFLPIFLLVALTTSIGRSAMGGPPAGVKELALGAIPYDRLTPEATQSIQEIVQKPTIFRRLPSQIIDCDPKMFVFLVRNPEVLVGIWDRMDVSSVQTQRIGPYQLTADDNAGTKCTIDLVYGDSRTHIYVGKGVYTGPLAARPITGSGVFILQSQYAENDGRTTVQGTLDCFIKIDSVGLDLVARTLAGLIGKTADHNFAETARFMSQVSGASERNPGGMRDLALELPQASPATRVAFAETIIDLAKRSNVRIGQRAEESVQSFSPASRGSSPVMHR